MDDGLDKPVSLRERQREQTRNHLLDVAADLIGSKGFNATSIDDLAKAAGAARATVYSYFDTKEAIVEEITRAIYDNAEAMYREFGDLADWDRASILGWLTDSVLTRWEQDRPRHRAARKGSTKGVDAMYRDYVDRYVAGFTQNAALWQARFSPTETRRRALMLISMVESYMWKLFTLGTEPDRVAVMETVADVFRDVLRAPD
jgi:AcrR family transcriptional regulator